MARIKGVDIPNDKQVGVSLTYIYGIGNTTAKKVLEAVKIDATRKVKDLSNEELDVLKEYEVWGEKKLYGKAYMGILRTTYVINEEGLIEKVYEKVKPESNAEEVLCEL
jgi:ribosomal protein S13